ncbi:MAG: TlpA family protein disulfide reductase [Chloroflexi bacterium]|nr:TlpA family protein disulfide reductase [Chloroflexota bacterium]
MRRQAGWLIFAGALMIGFVAGWWLWLAPKRAAAPAEPSQFPVAAGPQYGVFPGEVARDIRLPTLDGGAATLGEHRGGSAYAPSRGHRVLVNFFASWCDACRAEMPGVQAQAEKHAVHDWVVLGIDVMESREAAVAFRDEFGLTFPILLDEAGLVTQRYRVTGTPTSLFIDRKGVIVERRLGYMSEDDIEGIIDRVTSDG